MLEDYQGNYDLSDFLPLNAARLKLLIDEAADDFGSSITPKIFFLPEIIDSNIQPPELMGQLIRSIVSVVSNDLSSFDAGRVAVLLDFLENIDSVRLLPKIQIALANFVERRLHSLDPSALDVAASLLESRTAIAKQCAQSLFAVLSRSISENPTSAA